MDLGGEVDEGSKLGSLWQLMKEIWRYIMELMKEIIDHVKYMIILIKEGDYAIDGT
jgi:hypothetical protein